MRTLVIVILIAAAAGAGWFFGARSKSSPTAAAGERRVAFYQSPMHPWIKSDKPGNCTICGMQLTPIYEGEKGFDASADVVTLSSNSINVLHVQTEPVRRRALERQLVVAGRIESDERQARVISAYVDGRIDKLFVNFTGAEVKAGEPLALLYSPNLLTAEREYLTLLAQTNFAQSPALQSQHDRLVEGARQRLRRLGLTDEQIAGLDAQNSTNLSTLITAPISGTVVARNAFEGQYVKEGDKLFEIADLSRMWFRFNVYEQDLPLIKVGDPVRVTSPGLGARTVEGPISFIEPSINQETRSARVRVELQNPIVDEGGQTRRALYNGLYADGAIQIKTEPVLAVSKGAVLNPGDQPRVYVDQGGGAYVHRPVKVGRQGADYIEILEGLSEGDQVVTSGNLLIDSQAQLSRSASGSHEGHAHPSSPSAEPETSKSPAPQQKPVALSPDQANAVKEFYARFVFPMNEHLAADNLAGYNDLVAHAQHLAQPLASQFSGELQQLAAKLTSESGKLEPTQDLAVARAAYKSFSEATVEFYRQTAPALNLDGKIYKCPMFPKIGQNAFWVQAKPPLRNPFFGSEMLECGVEVK